MKHLAGRGNRKMRLCAWVGVTALALASQGETFTGAGYLNVSDPNWFRTYTSITFGEGCLDYTGGDVSTAVPLCFRATGARKVATLKVVDGTTLTLTQKDALVGTGGLIKSGKGTLALEGETVDFGKGTEVVEKNAPAIVEWNADGVLTAGWVAKGFNIHEGAVTIRNAAVNFGDRLRIGSMGSQNDSTLTIENSRVKPMANLYIGSWGTNTVLKGQQPKSRFVARNSVFEEINTITMNRTSGTYAKGHSLESEMTFDNCVVTNTGLFYMDPNTEGISSRTTLTLDNGTTFVNTYGAYGLMAGANVSISTNIINVLNGSKLYSNCFGADTYYSGQATNYVVVGMNSELGFMRSVSEHNAQRWSTAYFDGGLLRPWSSYLFSATTPAAKITALLFHRYDQIQVRPGGMTLCAPEHFYAYCFPALYPEGDGGEITVKGGGAFTISPTKVPINVTEKSTLVLTPRHFLNEDFGLTMNGNRIEYDPLISNGSVRIEDGSSIRVFGYPQTLQDMTLPAGAISFSGTGGNEPLSSKLGLGDREWKKAGNSCRLYDGDGAYTLMDGSNANPDTPQQVVYAKPLDLTRSFRITFEYSNAPLADRVVKGIVAYIHNDPRGMMAAGDGNQGLGYTTNWTSTAKAHIDKSVAMMLRTWNDMGLYFCKNGYEDRSSRQTFPVELGYYLQPDRIAPLVVTLAYDAEAKKFSYHVSSPYGKIYGGKNRSANSFDLGNTVSADLSAICGATGYFGVSSSADGGSPMQQQIANVSIRYLDALERPCADVAGNLALGSGTAKLTAYGTDAAAGYAMRELRYADGAKLDVASTNLAAGVENTAFVAFDKWTGSGTVTKTGTGNLGARTRGIGATLNLAEGGLVLRRDLDEETYTVDSTRHEWTAVNWRDAYLADSSWPLYTTEDGGKGVYCGTTDTGRSGSTALKRKLKVSGKWRLSFDYESRADDGAYGPFVTFHNDPRGYAAATDRGFPTREYAESYALKAGDASKSIKSCAAIQFYNYAESDKDSEANHKIKWWQSNAAGSFSASGDVLSPTCKDDSGNEQIYIANYDLKNQEPKVARKFHCEITHDDTAAYPLTIKLTQTQGANGVEGEMRTWQKSFAKNIRTAVGDDYCYFGLFFCTGGQTTRVKFMNLTFTHLDAAESNAESYFGKVNVTAPTAKVYLDGANAVAYKLADEVNVSGSLTVKSLRAAGTLDLGNATVANQATLTADGATVRLTSPQGLAPKSNLAVANGGALQLDFEGAASARALTIDGVTYRRGLFNAETCPAIKGPGSLSIGYGFLIMVK